MSGKLVSENDTTWETIEKIVTSILSDGFEGTSRKLLEVINDACKPVKIDPDEILKHIQEKRENERNILQSKKHTRVDVTNFESNKNPF